MFIPVISLEESKFNTLSSFPHIEPEINVMSSPILLGNKVYVVDPYDDFK